MGDLKAIIRSGWVLRPRTVIVLQLLTSQLSPVAIIRMSAQPMHVVKHLVQVAFVAKLGNTDQSSLSVVVSIIQVFPNLWGSRKVFLKHQVNWNTVCGAIQDLPWHSIWLAVEVLDVMYQPRSSVCATRISHGLMVNAGVLFSSSRRLIFYESVISHGLTGKSLSAVK